MENNPISKENYTSLGGIFEKNTLSLRDLIKSIKLNPKIGQAGAIFSFTGIVRETSIKHPNKQVKEIEIEVWPEKAKESLTDIAIRMKKRFDLVDIRVYHAYGILEITEDLVYVVVASKHRNNGLDAIKEIINEYKKVSPIWKKELFTDGSDEWLSGKVTSE